MITLMVVLLIFKIWSLSCFIFLYLLIVNLGDKDNRHACQTGHQLRAMAGTKFENSNEASLYACEEIKDNQPLIVRGTRQRWSEFKEDHSDWDFGNSITPEELFNLRGKFLHVWSNIGERLCSKYEMKFVKQNTPQPPPKPFHYILLLDASGSMDGVPWQNLLHGVKEFIKIRIDSNTADRITIIVFADDAKYADTNVDLKSFDLDKIIFTNGGTNFEKAFKLVVQTIKNVSSSNSASSSTVNLDFIIIFMSDGQAVCPNEQLNILLTMKMKIHQFWTVALGNTHMNILKAINDKIGGTFKSLTDSADLVQLYAEIARN